MSFSRALGSSGFSRLDRAVAAPCLTRCVTIVVVSPKGGVGKTTITALLGSLLARVRRDRTVAIDTNPDFGSLGRTLAPDHDLFVDDMIEVLGRPKLTVTELDHHLGAAPRASRSCRRPPTRSAWPGSTRRPTAR